MKIPYPVTILPLCAMTLLGVSPVTMKAAPPETKTDMAVMRPSLQVLEIAGEQLKDNPLKDPVKRRVAIFASPGMPRGEKCPVVYYLPGYGGSSEDYLRDQTFPHLVKQLAKEGMPIILVVVDCRNRWGGSQYLNSSAQGNYANYVCDEIVPKVEAQLGYVAAKSERVVAGHSSGGYGALMLGIQRHDLFGHVIAIAPDGDFSVTCTGWFKQPELNRLTAAEIEAIMSGPRSVAQSKGGLVELLAGISAAFAPLGAQAPGRFHWILDGKGKLQPKVWEQWLTVDPLEIVKRDANAFAKDQNVYLDGATQDGTLNNISARHIYEALRERHPKCAHHEAPGSHVHAVPERLERGLAWAFGKPLKAIP